MEPRSYTRIMGDVVINKNFTFEEAKLEIEEALGDAAVDGNWQEYDELTRDLQKLMENERLFA